MKDINGTTINPGDYVRCWDQDESTPPIVTAELIGVVCVNDEGEMTVGSYEVPLGCCEYVEVLEKKAVKIIQLYPKPNDPLEFKGVNQ